MKVVRLLVLVALAPLIASWLYHATLSFTRVVDLAKSLWVFVGAAAYLPLFVFAFARIQGPGTPPTLWSMLADLEHELSHLSLGAMLGRRAWKLIVHPKKQPQDDDTSKVIFSGDSLGAWVTLAPYMPPLLALLLLPAQVFVPPPYDRILAAAIGFVLCFRVTGLFQDLHPRQTDLKEMGYLFSYTVVPIAHLLVLFVILGVVSDRWNELWQVFLRGAGQSIELYAGAFTSIRRAWRSL